MSKITKYAKLKSLILRSFLSLMKVQWSVLRPHKSCFFKSRPHLVLHFDMCTRYNFVVFLVPLSSGDSPQWMVPISIATSANPTEAVKKVVLDKPSMTVTLENVSADQWVKVRLIFYGIVTGRVIADDIPHWCFLTCTVCIKMIHSEINRKHKVSSP